MKNIDVLIFILWTSILTGTILFVNTRVSLLEARLDLIEPTLHIPQEILK